MIEIKLPSLGADMDEGTLLEWHVKPGDEVHKGDILAVVDTTKAALDIECWHSGRVHDLLVEPGQTVKVGTLMARLLEPGEDAAAIPPPAPAAAAAPGAATATTGPVPPAETAAAPPVIPAALATRHPVSPAARRRAAELGIDVENISGTGPAGVVTLKDVELAAAHPAPAHDRGTDMRRLIATAMSRSKREIPHYYLSDDIPLRAATEWLRRTNLERPITERVLLAALYVRAVAVAAARHPDMNGFYVADAYRPSTAVHVGLAISLRGGGLVAPAIHDADRKPVSELMQALTDLVARTRAGKLKRDELADPTITLTNLGDHSVTSVHGVIYAPQVALVGFGEVSDRAWVNEGRVEATPVVTATLAADHRVSDGHAGARFLAAINALLQHPDQL
ncbi:MAG: 2-oxo acid dehydrogenase subunit E2 [Proteobacteria bacterium]|nr:2-oxo acid dehydrogenase subunit E2 [Pseudomonadota bacterium]